MSATPNTPTPSDAAAHDWTARETGPRRSVFGNYARGADAASAGAIAEPAVAGSADAGAALARAWLYRHLAQAFAYPARAEWTEWMSPDARRALDAAVTALQNTTLAQAAAECAAALSADDWERYHDAYVAAFGHAARGPIPMNEIEFGEPRADALYQPHRLADLSAFYRAYGLDLSTDAGERQDHLCVELEFLSVLAAKESWALDGRADAEALAACRESQRDFLREHLGRWAPAFARILTAQAGPGPLASFAALLRVMVEADCARFGVAAGADHLVVRKVDEAAERLCEGCGLRAPGPDAV